MPYSTTPITSGAAKFSTLDPDADLFLEENNITVGANPENPATLYDYDTSTLHITNIEANNGELNLSNSDLIGVKRFICEDYLGAVRANASSNTQWTLTLDNTTSSQAKTKKFRVPSNIVEPSSITVSFKATNTSASSGAVQLQLYTGSYTYLGAVTIPANTTTPTEYSISNISVKPGQKLVLSANIPNTTTIYGASGVKIQCDLSAVTGGYWEISD